jgi:hypothetical protein
VDFKGGVSSVASGVPFLRASGAAVQKEEVEVKVEVKVDPKDIPDVAKYDELSTTYEALKWRIISRPGGATMKPLNFYKLQGAVHDTSAIIDPVVVANPTSICLHVDLSSTG